MKNTNGRKVIMGEFLVCSEGLAFCIFPADKDRTACGAIVMGDHEGFASECIVASDSEPIASASHVRLVCCDITLRDMEFELDIKYRYQAPVLVRETAYIVPKHFKCGSLKFGDCRFIRALRPIEEVFEK